VSWNFSGMSDNFNIMKNITLAILGFILATSCNREPVNIPAQQLSPTSFQEDQWRFEYTSAEVLGSQVKDGFSDVLQASGRWAVFSFQATNTSKKALDVWDLGLESWILETSDGQRWEYTQRELYPEGLVTVKPNNSYIFKIAFDIPINVKPKTLIYQFYDDDFNQLKFNFNVSLE
jgi:hypothetical protein